MGASSRANGGPLLRDLRMPSIHDHAIDVLSPDRRGMGDTHVLGRFLRDRMKLDRERQNFRVVGLDETHSYAATWKALETMGLPLRV